MILVSSEPIVGVYLAERAQCWQRWARGFNSCRLHQNRRYKSNTRRYAVATRFTCRVLQVMPQARMTGQHFSPVSTPRSLS